MTPELLPSESCISVEHFLASGPVSETAHQTHPHTTVTSTIRDSKEPVKLNGKVALNKSLKLFFCLSPMLSHSRGHILGLQNFHD